MCGACVTEVNQSAWISSGWVADTFHLVMAGRYVDRCRASKGEGLMSAEEDKLLSHRCFEVVFTKADLAVGVEPCAAGEQEALAKKIFGLALALATEPSKLGQLRQMLVLLKEQRGLALDFSTWGMGQIDARVMATALEYAHDAEVLVQILSFKGRTCDSLINAIEDLYRHEQISQRVYVKAKLLLSTAGHKDAPN